MLLDPTADRPLLGWAAIASHIAYMREQAAFRMEPTSDLDAHHGVCRLNWRLASGGGVLRRACSSPRPLATAASSA